MITEKINGFIKNLTSIVDNLNVLLKSCEKTFKGVFYLITLIFIFRGTFNTDLLTRHKTETVTKVSQIIVNTNQVLTDEAVQEFVVKKEQPVEQFYYAFLFFKGNNIFDYIIIFTGLILMFVLLFKILMLFKKDSV